MEIKRKRKMLGRRKEVRRSRNRRRKTRGKGGGGGREGIKGEKKQEEKKQ